MAISRLNHAVLFVRDAEVSADFYVNNLGFAVTSQSPGAVFLTTNPDTPNDHDLGLFSIGGAAAPSGSDERSIGLYHLAWEVPTLREIVNLRERLQAIGALVGESDHGESKSLYCKDPDGLEFELVWAVPPELVDPTLDKSGVRPIDWTETIDRFGADAPGRNTYTAPA